MTFVIRKFDTEKSIGERLHDLRRAANFTLDEVTEATKIRRCFIEAFEADARDRLPEPLYARNYLRTYVRHLGGDETYFLERFEAERGTCDFTAAARLPRARARALDFLVASRLLKAAGFLLVAAGLLGYLGFQWRGMAAPPALAVVEPADGARTQEATIRVTGSAEPGSKVQVNGMPVLLSQDGRFDAEIVLERGLNVISVEGKKRYSKPATEYRRVLLETARVSAAFRDQADL